MVGQTCDSFDKVSLSVQLPANLEIGDYLLTDNIGAYSIASSTRFNGFDGAKIIHTNLMSKLKTNNVKSKTLVELSRSAAERDMTPFDYEKRSALKFVRRTMPEA